MLNRSVFGSFKKTNTCKEKDKTKYSIHKNHLNVIAAATGIYKTDCSGNQPRNT